MPELTTIAPLPGGLKTGDYALAVRPSSTPPYVFFFVPSKIAVSGSYADLSGAPAIPTTVNQLANDAGFITSAGLPGPSIVLPLVNGLSTAGTSLFYSRQDHVHPSDGSRYAASNPSGYQTVANVSTTLSAYAQLAAPVFTGAPLAPTAATGTSTTQIATTAFVAASVAASTTGVASFNTRTGAVVLSATDVSTALSFTPYNAANPASYITAAALPPAATVAPLGDGTATAGIATSFSRGDHVHPTDASRAPVASPALTGVPLAPTATVGTSTGQIATTSFVAASVAAATTGVSAFNTRTGAITLTSGDVTAALAFTPYNATNPGGFITATALPAAATVAPLVDATAAIGTSVLYARQDHAHPTDLSRAPLLSPALLGTPSAPTASIGTSTTQVATTAFVAGSVAAATTGVSAFNTRTGNVTLTSGDVTAALAFTPYNAANPAGFVTSAGLPGPGAISPAVDGTAAAGLSTLYARQDHVHPTDGSRYASTNPSGYQTAANVSASLGPYALLASPALSGVPTAPTATAGTATIQVATTAFVGAAVATTTAGVSTFNTRSGAVTMVAADVTAALAFIPYSSANPAAYITAASLPGPAVVAPAANGAAAIGISTLYARQDHAHPTDAGRAPVDSPAFTGAPTAPTAAIGTSTVQLATTAFVAASVAASTTGVASFNTRTGAIALTSGDVTTALAFTPYNATNPAGYQTSANVAAAIAPFAPLASPVFTGTPSVPGYLTTVSANATYALGSAIPAASTTNPIADGNAAVGTSAAFARADHVHPALGALGAIVTAGATASFATSQTILVVRKPAPGSATAISLPTSPIAWVEYQVIDGNGDSANNNISVTGNTTISGQASSVIRLPYAAFTYIWDGSLWHIT